MKLETHIPQEVIDAIAQMVAAKLKPMVAGLTSSDEDPLFNRDQLAAYLGVKAQWIYERVSLGEIPHTKVGKYLRFRKSVIDKWLESNSVPATSPCSKLGKLMGRRGAC